MIHQGDCLEVLKTLEDESIDSLVTDPPAGISFMGKDWDHHKGGRNEWIKWFSQIMGECLRVLKPGAHGLVWAIPRTSHWTATALEDAGFEIRDVVTHIFGSGFPKSHNIEKATGDIRFKGVGTALKPASEHWVLVRKPISEKTVAANTLKHGVGGINIEASRIGIEIIKINQVDFTNAHGNNLGAGVKQPFTGVVKEVTGRFPANLVLSHNTDCVESCTPDCAVSALDKQSGILKSGAFKQTGLSANSEQPGGWKTGNRLEKDFGPANSGGASRFFYVAKASKKDKGSDNTHPTVKSSGLMTYLIKLITPPNGVVLDPFAGSGTTLVAAKNLGHSFIGIEKDSEYIKIINKRINSTFQLEVCI